MDQYGDPQGTLQQLAKDVTLLKRRRSGGGAGNFLNRVSLAVLSGLYNHGGRNVELSLSGDGIVEPYQLTADLSSTALYTSNWNTQVRNGFYMTGPSALVNAPDSSNWWIGWVVAHRPTYVTQRVWSFTADITNLATTFERRGSEDVSGNIQWGPWMRVRRTYAGYVSAAVTSAAGDVTFSVGAPISLASLSVAFEAAVFRGCTIVSLGSNTVTIRVFGPGGTALASTAVTFSWFGTD